MDYVSVAIISLMVVVGSFTGAHAQPVRGAFLSPSVQILPMMVAQERGFYKREGLELDSALIYGRPPGAVVQ